MASPLTSSVRVSPPRSRKRSRIFFGRTTRPARSNFTFAFIPSNLPLWDAICQNEWGNNLRACPGTSQVALHRTQFLPKVSTHKLALREALEAELFVGRVSVVVGESEAEQERVGFEDAFEVIDDGNRAAFAHQN